MNEIHNHVNAVRVSCIYKIFDIIWGARSRGNCKEVCNVVSERGIVRVLLYCHQLYTVVAAVFDLWDHIISEFPIGGYFAMFRTLNECINNIDFTIPT